MKYFEYEVVESKSKEYPLGNKFKSDRKIHDGRMTVTELADKDCNSFSVRLIGQGQFKK